MTLTNGLVVMTPTSIAYSGTSATPNADGSVVFSACTSLSLNGVFTGDYDNYMITMRHLGSASGGVALFGRLLASGTDASGTDYTRQYLWANGTSVTAARETTRTEARAGGLSNVQRGGDVFYLYGPFLAQPTAFRYVSAFPDSSASIFDPASTHSLSLSYDGIRLFPNTGDFTGLLTVFGFNQ